MFKLSDLFFDIDMGKKFVFYFFLLSLIIPNVALSVTEPFSVIGAIANVVLPAGIIYLLLTLSPKLGKSIWLMFPLVFLAAFQIVLLDLYGRSIIAVDMFLNLVTTNATEVSELLGNMLPTLALVFILYLPTLIIGVIYIRRHVRLPQTFLKKNRAIASILTAIGAIILIISCIFPQGNRFVIYQDLYPVNVIYNIYLAYDRTVRTARYAETSAAFTYDAKSSHDIEARELYILIIGETSRAENWQLAGYDKKTNPYLSGRNDIFFGRKAISESNTTHKSVPMLISPAEACTFDSTIYNVKSLITAFKEAGYATAFISNQRYNHSFIDFFANESDSVIFIKELPSSPFGSNYYDADLLPYIDKIIEQHKRKQLIVVHTYGSHFNYRDRYGKTDRVFLPDDYEEATKANREKLINAYNNTIVATDRFINSCIERVDTASSFLGAVLYTSDHGEDIFDDGSGRFLHASPLPTIHQIHVPFLIWVSNGYRAAFPNRVETLSTNINELISTSRSYCPTAIQLAGITTSKIDTTASLISRGYTPREQLYLTDHNTPVELKSIL